MVIRLVNHLPFGDSYDKGLCGPILKRDTEGIKEVLRRGVSVHCMTGLARTAELPFTTPF